MDQWCYGHYLVVMTRLHDIVSNSLCMMNNEIMCCCCNNQPFVNKWTFDWQMCEWNSIKATNSNFVSNQSKCHRFVCCCCVKYMPCINETAWLLHSYIRMFNVTEWKRLLTLPIHTIVCLTYENGESIAASKYHPTLPFRCVKEWKLS